MVFLATSVWAVWEVGLAFWPLVSRLFAPAVLLVHVLLFAPTLRSERSSVSRAPAFGLAALLVLALTATVIAAFQAGGSLVDTADVYVGGVAEQVIGPWLAARPCEIVDRVVLATKGRFGTGPDVNDAGLSRRHLHRALDASLRRLGVETIDLYQLHGWDPHTPVEETREVIEIALTHS
jgi:diketogulonate reductase-like aldo/keto reductase